MTLGNDLLWPHPFHVTVLMAVHNERHTVTKAIDSLMRQTYEDWDLLIVDDGSTDGTSALLQDLAANTPKITLLRNPVQCGLATSLNRGWRQAQGTFIARMDADDICFPERLARQVDFMKNNPAVDVLGTGADLIDEKGHVLSTIRMPETHAQIAAIIHKRNPLFHPSVMMKKVFLERTGGYDERLPKSQDYELWGRACKSSLFHNLPHSCLQYQTKSYKRPVKTLWYGFYVQLKCARYNQRLFTGFLWASVIMAKSLLVNFGWYRPKSVRGNDAE